MPQAEPGQHGVMILNPAAGNGGLVEAVATLAQRRGLVVRRTQEVGDAYRFARDAVHEGAQLIAVAGGDGTLSETVNGLACVDADAARLLIVPMGTGNDFARTFELPRNDPEAALALLDQGTERRVDLVRVAGGKHAGPRYLVNAATGGFSELVHQHLDPVLKQQWGPLAYLRAAAEAAPELRNYDVHLTLDDEPRRVSCCALVVANGRFAGGGVELAPAADPQDHALDVLAVTAETFLRRIRVASQFAIGTQLQAPDVVFRRARTLRIEAEPPMVFSSDGDLIGPTPLRFEVVPGALRVIVPQPQRF